jgi:hypothetical protein
LPCSAANAAGRGGHSAFCSVSNDNEAKVAKPNVTFVVDQYVQLWEGRVGTVRRGSYDAAHILNISVHDFLRMKVLQSFGRLDEL